MRKRTLRNADIYGATTDKGNISDSIAAVSCFHGILQELLIFTRTTHLSFSSLGSLPQQSWGAFFYYFALLGALPAASILHKTGQDVSVFVYTVGGNRFMPSNCADNRTVQRIRCTVGFGPQGAFTFAIGQNR